MRAPVRGALVAVALVALGCSSGGESGAVQPATASSAATEPTASEAGPPATSSLPADPPATVTFEAADAVTTRTLELVDTTRPTRTSTGTFVASTRSLPTTVWVPAGSGPFPVVVFAHGFRDGVGPYARFATRLAEHGYLVAAPSFPLTDETRAGAYLDEADIDHEGADMSFVLTQLLDDPELSQVADATRIGAAGHSDGASVAVQLAYGPTGKDHRVRAVVALTAGSPGPGALSGPPMLLEQSDTDQYNDLSIAQELLDQLTTPWWFVLLHGATHSGPVEGDTTYTDYMDAVVIAFLDRYVKGAADAAFEDVAGSRPDLATITTG